MAATTSAVVNSSVGALVGRVIHDVNGARVGTIEEMRAVERDSYLEIREYIVGVHGALLRLLSPPVLRWVLEHFGVRGWHDHTVPADWVDLSDPAHPRMLKPKSALAAPHADGHMAEEARPGDRGSR